MAKISFKIERNNINVQGHSGFGRFNFLSNDRTRTITGKTNRQATEVLGQQVMAAYNKFCSENGVNWWEKEFGVKLNIEFEKYEYGK